MLKPYANSRRESGFTLIEAMIALLVVALGILAIGKLNGLMIAGSGHSKARAEAVALAEEKIEEFRRTALNNFDSIAAGGDAAAIPGKNASFARAWTVTAGPAIDSKQIRVTVAWTDAANAPQNVMLSTHVANVDAVGVAALTSDVIAGGRAISPPTGGARVGGRANPPPPPDDDWNPQEPYVVTTPNGPTELVLDDKVLLTIDDGREFSTISGTVFIEGTSVSPDNVFVMSSDASVCIKNVKEPITTLPEGASGKKDIFYTFFEYKCYVGPGWYGNIGIVRIDNANVNDRVCIGDPAVSVDVTRTVISRHPTLSTTRIYRGYEDDGSGILKSSGIGIGIETKDGVDGYVYTPVLQFEEEQHFLLTSITGQVTDEACRPQMELLAGETPFLDNAGKLQCLSELCPEVLPTGDVPRTTIAGTISLIPLEPLGPPPAITEVLLSGVPCSTVNGVGATSFTCNVDWLGWTGGAWNGELTVSAADDDIALTYSGLEPEAVTVVCDPPKVELSGITAEVQSITLNLIATKDGICP